MCSIRPWLIVAVLFVGCAGPAATAEVPTGTLGIAPLPMPAGSTPRVASQSEPAPTAATTKPTDVRQIRLAFTGDTLTHSPLWRQAQRNAGGSGYDFAPMFAELAPIVINADLGICHLETPIAPEGEELSTFPLYGVPAEVVTALAGSGYDRCSTASNHTIDRGVAGVDRTVAVLEAAGMGQSGMARTPSEIEPRVFEVEGVSIAHLSYTFSYNGLRLPDDQAWRSALIDPSRIIADATRARGLGADLVVASMHWGTEGRIDPTPAQRELAAALTASGTIDLIVGHHAHVLQPIEQVNGVWVAYGLGNIISNLDPGMGPWPPEVRDGAVLLVDVTVAAGGDVTVERPLVEPTWVDIDSGWVVRPIRPALADATTPAGRRAQMEQSLQRTRSVVGDYLVE